MECYVDKNEMSIAKYIIDTVDLKFEKVYEKFGAMDVALTLREINVRKELDHLNNLKADYEKSKLQDAKDYVKKETYILEHKTLTEKVEKNTRMLLLGLGGLIVLTFILKYFIH